MNKIFKKISSLYWLSFDLRSVVDFFYVQTSPLNETMQYLAIYGFWSGTNLYRATPAVTQNGLFYCRKDVGFLRSLSAANHGQKYTILYQLWRKLQCADSGRWHETRSQLLGTLRQSSENIMCKFLTWRQVDRVVDLSMKSLGIVISQ